MILKMQVIHDDRIISEGVFNMVSDPTPRLSLWIFGAGPFIADGIAYYGVKAQVEMKEAPKEPR